MPQPSLLQLREVAKTFRAGIAGCAACVRVLERVDLDVAPEECVVIQGSRGVGKTTLLLCAAGLLRPDRGTVRWRGAPASNDTGCAVRYLVWRKDVIVAALTQPSLPMVLLLDESLTRAAYPAWCDDAERLLERVRRVGGAVVIVTRDGRAVQHVATRVHSLVRGRLSDVVRAPASDTMPARVAEDAPHESHLSVDPLSGRA